ncbi:MAG: ATP-binding protein [Candidatus Omnitrophota bacterium]
MQALIEEPKKSKKSNLKKIDKKINTLTKIIYRGVGRAIADYNLIENNDKILVAVSGGKDSLSLLKILQMRQSFAPVKYDILAVHINMGYPCQQPKILESFFKENDINYYIEKLNILKPGQTRKDITCFWCSWNRRKAIFELAGKFGCNKVALGHHKDDITETILLNMFFQGEISAMAPRQELFQGKITIIRPFAYVEEKILEQFATRCNFPIPHCTCPNAKTSKRTLMKKIIKNLEKDIKDVKNNIFQSLKRIKTDYLL